MLAVKHSLYQLRKKSHLGHKHRMTPPPPKKTKEVSGDQGEWLAVPHSWSWWWFADAVFSRARLVLTSL